MALNLKDIKLKVKSKQRKSNVYENTKFVLESKKIQNEDPQEDYEEVDVSMCTSENSTNKKETAKPNEYTDWEDRKPGHSTITSDKTESKIKNQQDNIQLPTVVQRPSKLVTIKWKVLSIVLLLICVSLLAALLTVIVLMVRNTASPCEKVGCQYNGSCFVYDDKAVCSCFEGFSGEMCEITPCENITCMNNGTCYISDLKPRCACPNGFDGDICNVTPCSEKPCLHNGFCTYETNNPRHTCECQAGFAGLDCEVTPCSNEPCLNGGVCSYTIYSQHYTCSCPSGFYGNDCQVTPCSGNPCHSNGSCFVNNGSFVCHCQDGYSGTVCEVAFHDIIASPFYPNVYNNNANLSWTIDVKTGGVVSLIFKSFHTESSLDIVKIYDGNSASGRKIGQFSGVIELPTVVSSTQHYMHVTFTSDGSVVYKGFFAAIYRK